MAPIDPISPTSPMDHLLDLSPISPAEVAMLLSLPTTPVIAPAVYLPRLRTSFHMASSDIGNARRLSIQLQLPTPSPLSLGRTPTMEARSPDSMLCHRGSAKSWATSPTSALSRASSPRQPPRRGWNTLDSPSIVTRIPSLVRQDANERLERLLQEDLTSLPLRVNTSVTASRRRRSTTTDSAATQPLKSPSNTKVHSTTLSTLDSTHRSRSPIRKIRTHKDQSNVHRRRASRATELTQTQPPALLIRDPPSPTTAARETEIKSRIAHLSRDLVPLVSVTTGQPHPEFPTNLLRYQVLTHDQLNALARWYHQVDDLNVQSARWNYPCPIAVGKTWCVGGGERDEGEGDRGVVVVDLETKRRRWGRFIGLQGCESPVDAEREEESESVVELEARLDREWREALRRAREADKVRDKIWRGRF